MPIIIKLNNLVLSRHKFKCTVYETYCRKIKYIYFWNMISLLSRITWIPGCGGSQHFNWYMSCILLWRVLPNVLVLCYYFILILFDNTITFLINIFTKQLINRVYTRPLTITYSVYIGQFKFITWALIFIFYQVKILCCEGQGCYSCC